MKAIQVFEKIEQTLGKLKFAVIIIIVFALLMTVGTFLESYSGAEFAQKALYKTWPFMFVQFLMGLSILFAAFLRLPPKKRLYGFYTIHTGLILLGCGSFITWYAGIDGSITLAQNSPEREVILSEDIFKMIHADEGRKVTIALPSTAFKTTLNLEDEGIKLLDYYPFSEGVEEWVKPLNLANKSLPTGRYLIYNDNVAEEFTLTLNPEASDFKSTTTLGPLNIHFLPKALASCFSKTGPDRLIVWDSSTKDCFTPHGQNIEIRKTSEGNRFFAFQHNDRIVSFFPDFSPYPMDKNLKTITNSGLRVFSQKLFEEKPNLFILGNNISYFEGGNWVVKPIRKDGPTQLPWMAFNLKLERYEEELIPASIPSSVIPIQQKSQLIKGADKAVQIEVQGRKYWVTSERPLSLRINGKRVDFYVSKKTLSLPFEFVLSRFLMDTDPGTQTAASYESFVRVFTKDGPLDAHVYMNNPLKHEGFTFYQASYSKDPNTGQYLSTLSVNVDQGRPIKYLGSLLLVLGSAWHFILRRKKTKLKTQKA